MWVVWLSLVASLSIGGGIGYASQRWARIGVLLIGTWIGGILGGILYKLLIFNFAGENPVMVLWLSIAFFACLCSVLSMIFFDHAVIICSAIGGAYMFSRGISQWVGGFPNEFLLVE